MSDASNSTTSPPSALVLRDSVIMKSAIRAVEIQTLGTIKGRVSLLLVHWGNTLPASIVYIDKDRAAEAFNTLKAWLLVEGGVLTLEGDEI